VHEPPGPKDNDFYFRVCFLDPFQGTVMANYAFKMWGLKSVIIREVSNDYSWDSRNSSWTPSSS
jgi:branched-chain amino acid transport system substrate-binding protein